MCGFKLSASAKSFVPSQITTKPITPPPTPTTTTETSPVSKPSNPKNALKEAESSAPKRSWTSLFTPKTPTATPQDNFLSAIQSKTGTTKKEETKSTAPTPQIQTPTVQTPEKPVSMHDMCVTISGCGEFDGVYKRPEGADPNAETYSYYKDGKQEGTHFTIGSDRTGKWNFHVSVPVSPNSDSIKNGHLFYNRRQDGNWHRDPNADFKSLPSLEKSRFENTVFDDTGRVNSTFRSLANQFKASMIKTTDFN